jgi:hypothetical protein
MNKRTQIEGKVLIYVLGVFIASIILLFGFVVIDKFSSITYDIELLQFRQEVTQEIDIKLSEFRSRETLDLNLPSSFTQACFSNKNGASLAEAQGLDFVSSILSSTPPVSYNVFLMRNGIIGDLFSVNKLSLSQDFVCFEVVDGSVSFTLVAKGKEGVDII